ncbi:hypothetical protein Rruber_05483 (plasmid) [Rhodococcus ruber]
MVSTLSTLNTACQLIPNWSAASWADSTTAPAIADLLKQGNGRAAGEVRQRAVPHARRRPVRCQARPRVRHEHRRPNARSPSGRRPSEPNPRASQHIALSAVPPPSASDPAARCIIRDGYASETELGSLNHSAGAGATVSTASSPTKPTCNASTSATAPNPSTDSPAPSTRCASSTLPSRAATPSRGGSGKLSPTRQRHARPPRRRHAAGWRPWPELDRRPRCIQPDNP